MKCQKCDNPATFHITEILDGKPVEIHLCSEHAQEYLNQTQDLIPGNSNMASALASHLAQQLALTKVSTEFSETDQETCPTCGNTFFEFRTQSRLGCPEDYTVFRKQMDALLMNIHGETTHVGKKPKHFGEEESRRCTSLIGLRHKLEKLVEDEKYEEASVLRDKIRQLEKEAGVE